MKKLTIDIKTDGTIHPGRSIEKSIQNHDPAPNADHR